MNKTRVIPVLLLRGEGLVKTIKFKDPKYIGDPINSVRIFNEKEVDELVFLDITATCEARGPNFDVLRDIASEAFMPMAYGGGITSLDHVKHIFALGFEKVIINTAAYSDPGLIKESVSIYGSQSIVACVDVRRSLLGRYDLVSHSGNIKQSTGVLEHVKFLEDIGVGEIIVNSVDREGTYAGYDIKLLKSVSSTVNVPVVASGGASGVGDFVEAIDRGGASAVAAGSLFVFVGTHKAVLINYPKREELEKLLP